MHHSTPRSIVLLTTGFFLGVACAWVAASLRPERTGAAAALDTPAANRSVPVLNDGAVSIRSAAAPAPFAPSGVSAEVREHAASAQRARHDPTALNELIARFLQEGDATKRGQLRDMLMATDAPQIMALAEQLVVNADPAMRVEGLQLLQG